MKQAGKIALCCSGALLAASQIERNLLTVNRYKIYSDRVEKTVRLVYLSDLHDHAFGRENRRLVAAVEKEQPDIILLGGDMITTKPWKKQDMRSFGELLCGLKERLCGVPVILAPGNHELRMRDNPEVFPGWLSAYKKLLEAYQVKLLVNDSLIIDGVQIHGFVPDEAFYRRHKPEKLTEKDAAKHFEKKDPDRFTISLVHSPAHAPAVLKLGADLVFSGHYHGGLIRIPGIGAVFSPDKDLFPKYSKGMYLCEGGWLCVSAGLGTHTINVRLCNPPEIVSVCLSGVRDEGD